MLQPHEQKYIYRAYELAMSARAAPSELNKVIEPTWSVMIAHGEKILAEAVFRPGDREDAIKVAFRSLQLKTNQVAAEELTLYISLEPSSIFQRLMPTTESIRQTGIRKIIIGAENPSKKMRGKGIETLRNQGITVLMAEGEEARYTQLLYEDYGKVMNQKIPLLRLSWSLELKRLNEFNLYSKFDTTAVKHDILLVRASDDLQIPSSWLAVIDPDGSWIKENEGAKNVLVFTAASVKAQNVFEVPREGDSIDLATILRKLHELGFMSVLLSGDIPLFSQAIRAGLVDSVISSILTNVAVADVLSDLNRAQIDAEEVSLSVRLDNPRFLIRKNDSVLVESRVRFAN